MAKYEARPLSFVEAAPFIAEGSITVAATAAEVWAVLADHRGWSQWFAAIKECAPTSDPAHGVGSTRTVTLAGGLAISEEFIAWDEPELWAFTATSGPPVVTSLVERVMVGPTDAGRTTVTYRMAAQPRRGLGWMLRLIRPAMVKNLTSALRALDAQVQARRKGEADGAESG